MGASKLFAGGMEGSAGKDTWRWLACLSGISLGDLIEDCKLQNEHCKLRNDWLRNHSTNLHFAVFHLQFAIHP